MQRLIKLLDDPNAVIESADRDDWPGDFIHACDEAGIVVPCSKHSDFIRCPGCDDPHDVEVRSVWFNRKHHSIAVCSASGVMRIDSSLVQQWRPSLLGLAKMVANTLGIENEPESAAGVDAWIVGNVVRGGKAIRVCVGRRSARWDRIILPNVQHAVIQVGHFREAGALATTTVIKATELVRWSAREGVTIDVDLIRSLLQLNPDGHTGLVPRDGFVWPDTLTVGGKTHRCPSMKPQLKKLLSVLSIKTTIPIEDVVHDGEDAVWQQPWNPNDNKLIRAIRSALNELKNRLAAASPPLITHFKFEKKWEHIRRCARR